MKNITLNSVIKMVALAALFIIGLILLVCESDDLMILVATKVAGGACWYWVMKLFNHWRSELKEVNNFVENIQ